jgi:hypothetical protein
MVSGLKQFRVSSFKFRVKTERRVANTKLETRNWKLAFGFAAFVFLSAGALAETDLPDPTQPPAGVFIPQGEGQSGAASPGGGLILQSVLISPTRKAAIISGKTLALGDKIGNANVVSISETEVVLLEGDTKQVLSLFPTTIVKKPIIVAKPAKKARSSKSQ